MMKTMVIFLLCAWTPLTLAQDSLRDAKRALREKDFSTAISLLDEALENKIKRADEALYWRAYALSKANRRAEALEDLSRLTNLYAESRWYDDAEALMIELGGAGRSMERSNINLKLTALSALMNQDPERAVKSLHTFLKNDFSVDVKRKALFVLVQHGDQEAAELVGRIARSEVYPELRGVALEMVGHFNRDYAIEILAELYGNETDEQIKEKILHGFMIANAPDEIVQIIDEETHVGLRKHAIQQLGIIGADDQLGELYARESDPAVKRAFVDAFAISGEGEHLLTIASNDASKEIRVAATRAMGIIGDCSALIQIYREDEGIDVRSAALDGMQIGGCDGVLDIAKEETDPDLRGKAITALGLLGNRFSAEISTIYHDSDDPEIKHKALSALFLQQNASQLIEIAKDETDPKLKSKAVSLIGMIATPEAKQFLIELIDQQ